MNLERTIAVSPDSDQDLTVNIEAKIDRPWSNLPDDIISSIMQFLNMPDQIRFSCVCKNYRRQPIHHDRPVDRLPWLVTCHDSESDGFLCKLFDPLQKNPQEVHQVSGRSIGGWFRPNYVMSKDGWLFFLKEKHRYVDELFLFCPYTKEIISLPELHHGFWEYKNHCYYSAGERMRILTFSSPNPKSEQCVFYVAYYLYNNGTHGKITICSYQPNKEKQWRTKTTFYGMKYVKTTNLLYKDGNLYIMNKEGCLGIYDVISERWSFKNYWSDNNAVFDHRYSSLIAYNDIILLAVMDEFSNWKLYRLEDSSTNYYKEWIHQSGLENEAMFMAHQPCECNMLVDKLSGDLEHVGNKIFYHQMQENLFFERYRYRLEISNVWKYYELNASESLVCEGREFGYFVPREEGKKSVIRMNKNLLALWIAPPNYALNRFLH